MAITRRHIVTTASILYLLFLTLLAIYALHSSREYTLPIPNLLSALTLALPALSGLLIETSTALLTPAKKTLALPSSSSASATPHLLSSPLFLAMLAALLVYETVLATLAGTHIAPQMGLNCSLQETWQRLFHNKDGERISAIQDGFQCCGFNSVKDRAYPFPVKGRGADACSVNYDRQKRCADSWRQEERKVGGMLLAVALGAFVWKVLILFLPYLSSGSTSWLPSSIRLPRDNNGGRGGQPRQIAYRDAEAGDEDSIAGEVRRLNDDSRLASQVEGGRVRPSALMPSGGEEWRREVGDD